MAATDLFPASGPTELDLPAIDIGPIKFRVGQAHCILRPKETAKITSETTYPISARKKIPAYTLANGEKVAITTQKKHKRPAGFDGLLMRGTDGRLSWLSHKQTDAANKEIKAAGPGVFLSKRAAQWDGAVTYKAELQNSDGTVSPGSEGLRPPQLGALFAIGSHWSLFNSPATIIMPTGTGKTETMLAALAAFVRHTLLVVVPSDALRSQTAGKFLTFGLLRALKVLSPDAPNPIVGVLTKVPKTTADLDIFKQCTWSFPRWTLFPTKQRSPSGATSPPWWGHSLSTKHTISARRVGRMSAMHLRKSASCNSRRRHSVVTDNSSTAK